MSTHHPDNRWRDEAESLRQQLHLQKAATAVERDLYQEVHSDYLRLRDALERLRPWAAMGSTPERIINEALTAQRERSCPHDTKHAEWVCDECGDRLGRVDHKSELTGRPRR